MSDLRIPGTSGIVLAGGKSSRFGSDKASAPLGGRPMLDWVVAALAEVCEDLVVVRAPGQVLPPIAAAAFRITEDEVAGEGPLAGIIAGFEAAAGDRCFVTSCDAPLLQPALVALALTALDRLSEAAVPVREGRPQPLHAAYRRTAALTAARDAFAEGARSLQDLLRRLRTVTLDAGEVAAADPRALSFWNANDPATLEGIARELGLSGAL